MMQENEKVLIKADIRFVMTKARIVVDVLYYVLVNLILFPNLILCYKTYIKWDDIRSLCFGAVIYLLFLVIPFLTHRIIRKKCRATSLYVSNSDVTGNIQGALTSQTMNIPIEAIDNVIIVSSLFDKMRSGNSLKISTTAGNIILHYVHNAKEVTDAIMQKRKNKGK